MFLVIKTKVNGFFAMKSSNEQMNIASQIDKRFWELSDKGVNDIEIFRDMSDLMPGFKRLMDTAGHEGIQQLCTQYEGLYQYAKILESIAEGIHSGKIKVPK